MSKTIKLNDETYIALEDFRKKRETFDDAVARLISVSRQLQNIVDALAMEPSPGAAAPGSEGG